MRFVRKLHKWLGLIVGIQLLLWSVSGLMFAWLKHEDVVAEHSAHAPEPAELAANTPLAEPSTWIGEYGGTQVYEIRLISLLDQWLWRVELGDRVELRQTSDGKPFKIDAAFAERLARGNYKGDGDLTTVTLYPTSSSEARDAGSVWEARFDDLGTTTLYFSADDGKLVETRNSTWRLYDFFWMLHTMDYRGRDNFNNPLVIAMGTGALWLSLSGVILLTRSFRRRPAVRASA
jgi:uncharacterized iron-regulated membrane protein